jgi:hypothetical protein
MFNGFFGQYTFLGIIIFLFFFAMVLLEGILLARIFGKSWVVFPVGIIGVIIFYFIDLAESFLFLFSIGVVISSYYFIKKQKKQN